MTRITDVRLTAINTSRTRDYPVTVHRNVGGSTVGASMSAVNVPNDPAVPFQCTTDVLRNTVQYIDGVLMVPSGVELSWAGIDTGNAVDRSTDATDSHSVLRSAVQGTMSGGHNQ